MQYEDITMMIELFRKLYPNRIIYRIEHHVIWWNDENYNDRITFNELLELSHMRRESCGVYINE